MSFPFPSMLLQLVIAKSRQWRVIRLLCWREAQMLLWKTWNCNRWETWSRKQSPLPFCSWTCQDARDVLRLFWQILMTDSTESADDYSAQVLLRHEFCIILSFLHLLWRIEHFLEQSLQDLPIEVVVEFTQRGFKSLQRFSFVMIRPLIVSMPCNEA